MIIEPTEFEGLHTIHPEPFTDERGEFSRIYSVEELARHGISFAINQVNRSLTKKSGTVRGMHFQSHPHGEAKIIQCIRGAVYDVAVDMRPESPTYLQWHGVELTENNSTLYYIPVGFAHGFQTLEDRSELLYFMSTPYVAAAANGVRWDDPKIQVHWPLPVSYCAEKDAQWNLIGSSMEKQ